MAWSFEAIRKGRSSALQRLLEVATAYNVSVTFLASGEDLPRGVERGGRGGGCCPRRRRVWAHQFMIKTMDAGTIAAIFHEIVHCIVEPPEEMGIKKLEYLEAAMLLQFERQLAKAVFPRQIFAAVQEYQRVTYIGDDMNVNDWPRYWTTSWWRLGLSFCQRVDLLDSHLRPRFAEQPKWQWLVRDDLKTHAEQVLNEAYRTWRDPNAC